MTNRILDVVVANHRLDPVETELRVHVRVESLTPTTEIRGRLLGPRCLYASTIEIAYPLREVSRGEHIELRAIIPEPSWWDPESPFVYEGMLELLQDGVSCGQAPLRHGIRQIQITSRGLRLNGQQYTLRGKFVEPTLTDVDGRGLRAAGFNTLITNVADANTSLWSLGDRLGFFVLGTSNDIARHLEIRNELTGHPSAFGWVFGRVDFLAGPSHETGRAMFYGVNTSAPGELPNADFLCCLEQELAWLDAADVPKIVVVLRLPESLPTRSDVIGWIETP